MTCEICNRNKKKALIEFRELSAKAIAGKILAFAAQKALTIPDHDTENHPTEEQ